MPADVMSVAPRGRPGDGVRAAECARDRLRQIRQLFLDNGNWNGKQIIPARWVIESTTRDPNDNRSWKTYPEFRDGGGYYKYFWWGRTFGPDDYIFKAQGSGGSTSSSRRRPGS
jgi:CubicO group peptidase (beta-lactamase class C family)